MSKVKDKLIPINNNLFCKYSTVKEIFENEKVDEYKIVINETIPELDNKDINNIDKESGKELAIEIFNNYHKTNIFINSGNEIIVTNNGIREAFQKTFDSPLQKELIKEHYFIMSVIGTIIKHAKLKNQANNTKPRKNPNIYYWNYYLDGVIINGKKYKIIFDVRPIRGNLNQFRVQRIELDKY